MPLIVRKSEETVSGPIVITDSNKDDYGMGLVTIPELSSAFLLHTLIYGNKNIDIFTLAKTEEVLRLSQELDNLGINHRTKIISKEKYETAYKMVTKSAAVSKTQVLSSSHKPQATLATEATLAADNVVPLRINKEKTLICHDNISIIDNITLPQIGEENYMAVFAFLPNPKDSKLEIYIDKERLHANETGTFLDKLKRKGFDFTKKGVSLSEIVDLTRHASQTNTLETSELNTFAQSELKKIFNEAAHLNASDIHLTIIDEVARLEFRLNGKIRKERELPATLGKAISNIAYNMAGTNVDGTALDVKDYQGGRISAEAHLPKGITAMRLQFVPLDGDGNSYMIIRLLSAKGKIDPSLKNLGFSEIALENLDYLRKCASGIIVISGPTGHGKSTTLQRTMLNTVSECKGEKNILTIEDPPEYPIPGVKQIPITLGEKKSDDEDYDKLRSRLFGKAIRAALRSDPDIIMIGEIRDEAAAGLAIKAAISGHLVWTTLHANSAMSCLIRLGDLGVQNFFLGDASVFRGLTHQRLVSLSCPKCAVSLSEAMKSDDEELKIRAQKASLRITRSRYFNDNNYNLDKVKISSHTHSCDECYKAGRTVVAEVLVPDQHILSLINNHRNEDAYDYWVKNLGGETMLKCGFNKIMDGVITIDALESQLGPISEFAY